MYLQSRDVCVPGISEYIHSAGCYATSRPHGGNFRPQLCVNPAGRTIQRDLEGKISNDDHPVPLVVPRDGASCLSRSREIEKTRA